MKIQVLGVEKNELGNLLAFCPRISSFKFSFAFGILASAWGLKGALKLSNLNLQASTLDI